MDLQVDVCHATTERNALKMKVDGLWIWSNSKVIYFEKDKVFVPEGFVCHVQLTILESCWYRKLSKPRVTEFFARNGQLPLFANLSLERQGDVEYLPEICPISKILLKPVPKVCILLQDRFKLCSAPQGPC